MKTIFRIGAKGFGIALMVCASLSRIGAATGGSPPDATMLTVSPGPPPFWSRFEVQLIAGALLTAAGYLLKRDRDSIDNKVDGNHAETVEWLRKIDSKVHTTAEDLAGLKGACEARRKAGEC